MCQVVRRIHLAGYLAALGVLHSSGVLLLASVICTGQSISLALRIAKGLTCSRVHQQQRPRQQAKSVRQVVRCAHVAGYASQQFMPCWALSRWARPHLQLNRRAARALAADEERAPGSALCACSQLRTVLCLQL